MISIIIPLYNREDLILETLDSVKSQTYSKWECIIVDDRSTDNSFNVVEDYIKNDKRFKLLTRPSELKKGAPSCRNYGLSKSNGVYCVFFDSDDIMLRNYLRDQLKCIKGYDLSIINNAKFQDNTDKIYDKTHYEFYSDKNLLSLYLNGRFSFFTNSAFWSINFLKKNNLSFDTRLTRAQEAMFHLKAIYHRPKVKFERSIGFLYRIHKTSITNRKNTKDYWMSKYLFYKEMCKLSEDINDNHAINKNVYNLMSMYVVLLSYTGTRSLILDVFKHMKKTSISLKKRVSLYVFFVVTLLTGRGLKYIKNILCE